MRTNFRRLLCLAFGVSIPLMTALVSCTQQGEGQRCSHKNGNDDCDTGLVCTSSTILGGNADICCPADLKSTAPECIPGGGSTSTGTGTTGAGGAQGTSSASGTSTASSTTTTGSTTASSTASSSSSSASTTSSSGSTTSSTSTGG